MVYRVLDYGYIFLCFMADDCIPNARSVRQRYENDDYNAGF